MDELEKELKISFLEEAAQLIVETEQAFLDLEGNSEDPSLLDKIFRMAHNLKGTSRAVGFGNVAEFTHELESMLLKIKQGDLKINTSVVNVLLACNDFLSLIVGKLQENLEATFDSSQIIKEIHHAISTNGGEAVSPSTETHSTEAEDSFEKEDKISAEAISALEVFEAKRNNDPYSELYKPEAKEDTNEKENAPDHIEKISIKEPLDIPKEKGAQDKELQKNPSSSKIAADETIRVKLHELEKLNNYVGELVILQTVLNQHKNSIDSELIQKTISQLEKLSKEIQSISMGLRMIPIKQTFQKMQRVVRDVSRSLNKKVKLELSGETTEVDKTVLEMLADPLVHIIRNAVDHGLECDSKERLSAGKPEVGKLSLHAFHEGNNLVIEIKDDGQGIDPEKIRGIAIEKGLLSEDAKVTSEEAINFIFNPGFSTKQEISEISGRGVGMDVVKHNIQSLSGDVHVITEKGKGSTFKVVLPLTLAIIDGIITEVGEQTFVFPISQIHETLQPRKEMVSDITGLGPVLTLRGEVMPIYRLSKTLNVESNLIHPWEGILVIVRNNNGVFAVLVDEIVRLQQVVIKNLGDEIKNSKGMIGSAILGDGLPSVILDLNELFNSSNKLVNKGKNHRLGAV